MENSSEVNQSLTKTIEINNSARTKSEKKKIVIPVNQQVWKQQKIMMRVGLEPTRIAPLRNYTQGCQDIHERSRFSLNAAP